MYGFSAKSYSTPLNILGLLMRLYKVAKGMHSYLSQVMPDAQNAMMDFRGTH